MTFHEFLEYLREILFAVLSTTVVLSMAWVAAWVWAEDEEMERERKGGKE